MFSFTSKGRRRDRPVTKVSGSQQYPPSEGGRRGAMVEAEDAGRANVSSLNHANFAPIPFTHQVTLQKWHVVLRIDLLLSGGQRQWEKPEQSPPGPPRSFDVCATFGRRAGEDGMGKSPAAKKQLITVNVSEAGGRPEPRSDYVCVNTRAAKRRFYLTFRSGDVTKHDWRHSVPHF